MNLADMTTEGLLSFNKAQQTLLRAEPGIRDVRDIDKMKTHMRLRCRLRLTLERLCQPRINGPCSPTSKDPSSPMGLMLLMLVNSGDDSRTIHSSLTTSLGPSARLRPLLVDLS